MEKDDISPDSLSPTPRKKQIESHNDKEEKMYYSRKRNVVEYINSCETDKDKDIGLNTFPR